MGKINHSQTKIQSKKKHEVRKTTHLTHFLTAMGGGKHSNFIKTRHTLYNFVQSDKNRSLIESKISITAILFIIFFDFKW